MSAELVSVNCVRMGWGRRTVEGSLLDSADGDISDWRVKEEKPTNDRGGKWALVIQGGWSFRLRSRHVPVRKRFRFDIWGNLS